MIIKIISICLIAAFLLQIFKTFLPSFVPVIALATGVITFFLLSQYIKQIFDIVNGITENIEGFSECIKIAAKAVSISVICEFFSQLCDDMGEKYLSSKIEFAGKVIIICLTAPELINIINTATDLILNV